MLFHSASNAASMYYFFTLPLCTTFFTLIRFIVQDIATDYKSPNMWNVNAARLINIHILDPISCESVTHIVPPPIPMSVHDAVLAKLPFFVVEEQIDNRLEGGDFDNVKSVSKTDEAKGIASEPTLDPNQPVMCSSCERRLCDCVYVTVPAELICRTGRGIC